MYHDHGHLLLAQVPLTVSPFISLPTAVTLPYTYKSVRSSLPPSVIVDPNGTERPRYVVSSSGHAAHPDEIIASCQNLQRHVQKVKEDATRTIKEWENGIKERELAEKRRVAPGWLDREEKILEPTKAERPQSQADLLDRQSSERDTTVMAPAMSPSREGEELDRAFGGLNLNRASVTESFAKPLHFTPFDASITSQQRLPLHIQPHPPQLQSYQCYRKLTAAPLIYPKRSKRTMHPSSQKPAHLPGRMSTSPLAFLDDPFHSYSSTLLSVSTIVLATALIFHLMGQYWRRPGKYSRACPLCEQSRKEFMIAGRDWPKDFNAEGLEDGKTSYHWRYGASPSSNAHPSDLLGSGEGSDHSRDSGLSGSSYFFTPTRRRDLLPQRGLGKSHPGDGFGCREQVVDEDRDLASESPQVGVKQSMRAQLPQGPTMLSDVVVGEVKESVIAQRRRLTLSRED